MRLLIVEDEEDMREALCYGLRKRGYAVDAAGDGADAVEQCGINEYDLVVLDLNLPGLDGMEVLKHIRSMEKPAKVLILSARSELTDKIRGLDSGASDYLTKPFSPRELVLRIEAILRRGTGRAVEREVLQDGDLTIDPVARKAFRGGRELDLTLREFDLLAYFLAHPNQVLSRDDLLAAVWGWQIGDASTVTVHVRRLRGKLEADPAHPTRLVTVWGRGYRWEARA